MPDLDLSRIPRSPKAAATGYLTGLMKPTSTSNVDTTEIETENEAGNAVTSDIGATSQGAQHVRASFAGSPTEAADDQASMN
jgi:hypothetical protein